VLGSSLSELFLKLGDEVTVTDITRIKECWRLTEKGILDQVEYKWKSSQDISQEDLDAVDLVIDCAIGFPDRPFGNESPRTAIGANLEPAVGLLESLRKLTSPPPVIYQSSFNALYGLCLD
jgi:nucleoside-diphosphate-sugar epimerase